jgi:hypothetical protein
MHLRPVGAGKKFRDGREDARSSTLKPVMTSTTARRNDQLAQVFDEIADMLELRDDSF